LNPTAAWTTGWFCADTESVLLEAGCNLLIPALVFVSMTIDTVHQLPRSEKLKLMETLWEELSRPDTEFDSPAWHARELAETERRLAAGKEQVMDWEKAKKALRSKFE
jgi:Putative addiction module component